MASNKSTGSNKFLLLLIPVLVIGAIWGIKTVFNSNKTAEPTATASSSGVATAKLSPEVMTELQKPLNEAVEELEGGDLTKPKREYAEWKETWTAQEAIFKKQSPVAYENVEKAYKEVESTFINAPKPDKEKAIAAFKSLSAAVRSAQ